MQTEKFQPEDKQIMQETRFTEFPALSVGSDIFHYFNFTVNIKTNTYSTSLGIGTEAKCLLSSSS